MLHKSLKIFFLEIMLCILAFILAFSAAANLHSGYEGHTIPRPYYDYGYAVHDEYSGNNFNAQESANGKINFFFDLANSVCGISISD